MRRLFAPHRMYAAAGAALVVMGCSLFTAETIPAIVSGMTEVARLVKQKTARDLADVPTECITENHPEAGKLLLLCTVCYDLQPGEACR